MINFSVLHIKKYLRQKYIIYKYKHNYNTGKLIYLNSSDRQYGLTTLLIHDAIKFDVPILVSTEFFRRNIAHEIYRMGQLELVPPVTERYAYEKLVITSPHDNVKGRRMKEILVDNQCSESDVDKFLICYGYPKIRNGFVTKRF